MSGFRFGKTLYEILGGEIPEYRTLPFVGMFGIYFRWHSNRRIIGAIRIR